VTSKYEQDPLLKVFGFLIMFVLLMVVMPAGIWAFLLIAYYFWSTVLGWLLTHLYHLPNVG
jgi:hypothetical protein